MFRPRLAAALAATVAPAAVFAQTQDVPATAATRPLEATAAQPSPPPAQPVGSPVMTAGRAALTLSGYVETFWQWNFNDPANGVTAWRGFDNRHNTFSVSNVVLDASWQYRLLQGRLALQVGLTPDTYYRAEPSRSVVPGAGATGPDLWKYIQQATVGLRIPGFQRLLVEAGIFLSPVGPETMAVRDNWNWSRSNLFYALPYYHTGLRATLSVSERHALALMVTNGWNSVVDNNAAKSVMLQYTYTPTSDATLSALYLGGIERDDSDPAGPGWRHVFDVYARFRAGRRVTVMAHVNAGFESTRAGTLGWSGVAAYGRFDLTRALRLAARVDVLQEFAPEGAERFRIFFPTDIMSSQTLTFEAQPIDHVLVRLEYRHDVSGTPAFYRGAIEPMGASPAFNARSQDTLTAGMTAWF